MWSAGLDFNPAISTGLDFNPAISAGLDFKPAGWGAGGMALDLEPSTLKVEVES